MAKTDRLFFALFPDAETAAQIWDFAREFAHSNRMKGQPIAPERLHVTLAFLGDFDGTSNPMVEAAKMAASQVAMGTFTCGFDRVATFRGRDHRRPHVLLSADEGCLVDLHDRLAAALARAGLTAAERRFTPHVTLVYDDALVEEQPAGLYKWRVNEFALVRSLIGRATYTILGRWPLAGEGSHGREV
jgi:2'-5' RNA ligase